VLPSIYQQRKENENPAKFQFIEQFTILDRRGRVSRPVNNLHTNCWISAGNNMFIADGNVILSKQNHREAKRLPYGVVRDSSINWNLKSGFCD
jgi:hypothetical protein